MKILVTGAAGFIGSYISRELLRRGDDVIGVDNFSNYYSKRAKLFNLDLTRFFTGDSILDSEKGYITEVLSTLESFNKRNRSNKKRANFKFYDLDIRQSKKLEKLFKDESLDAVIHLAAMAGVPYSIKKPRLYTSVNIDGTVNLLDASVKYGVKKFVFGSSSSVYGDTNKVPFSEDQDVDHPISPYAATKRMGEIVCYTYSYLYDISIICARIFGPIFGPLQRPYGMAAQRFIRQVDKNQPITIYGDGLMRRDSTYIDDEVKGLIKCLDADIKFDLFNIGTGEPVSVQEMADLTIKYMKKGEIKYQEAPPTEVSVTYADVTKAKRYLNFEAEIPYEEGIMRQIKVYNMMPEWYRNLRI